ncbi:hypothetical protein L6R52_12365 [Myxococcota bacterium]|nr:hypothetical protein [Myxococcota bacterium]
MSGVLPILSLAALVGAVPADVKNPALAEGIRLYDAKDHAAALVQLTAALDRPSSRRDSARIHLYIGLIQHAYTLAADAEASFTKAIGYDPKVDVPKGAPTAAKLLVQKVRQRATARGDEPKKRPPPTKGPKRLEPLDPERAREAERDVLASETSTATAPRDTADPRLAGTSPRELDDALPLPPPVRDDAVTTSITPEPATPSSPVARWIVLGAGVAAVTAGATLGVLSTLNGRDANEATVASRAEALYETAVDQRTAALVSVGIGGAALGVAALLFFGE